MVSRTFVSIMNVLSLPELSVRAKFLVRSYEHEPTVHDHACICFLRCFYVLVHGPRIILIFLFGSGKFFILGLNL